MNTSISSAELPMKKNGRIYRIFSVTLHQQYAETLSGAERETEALWVDRCYLCSNLQQSDSVYQSSGARVVEPGEMQLTLVADWPCWRSLWSSRGCSALWTFFSCHTSFFAFLVCVSMGFTIMLLKIKLPTWFLILCDSRKSLLCVLAVTLDNLGTVSYICVVLRSVFQSVTAVCCQGLFKTYLQYMFSVVAMVYL